MSEITRGMRWSLAGRLAQAGLSLLWLVWLARLLTPEAFGLVGMVAVVTGVVGLGAHLGVGAALVHRRHLAAAHRDTAFWMSAAAGTAWALALAAASPGLAAFFGEPELAPLTQVLALGLAAQGVAVVPRALLTRALRFRTLAWVEGASLAGAGALAVAMAYHGYGVWSLAAQQVLGAALLAVLSLGACRWRPGFKVRRLALRQLAAYGTPLLATRLLDYGARNLDDLLLGRFYGAQALGLYGQAYLVLLFPVQVLARALDRVLFPALARRQQDARAMRAAYLQAVQAVALVTFPLMTALFVLADLAVAVGFGAAWRPMVPLVRLFCVLGVVQSVVTLNGSLFQATGRVRLQLRVGVWTKLGLMAGIVAGLPGGALGVAVGYTAASALGMGPALYAATRPLGLTLRQAAAVLRRPVGVALGVLVLSLGARVAAPAAWPPAAVLGLAGGATVMGCAALLYPLRAALAGPLGLPPAEVQPT